MTPPYGTTSKRGRRGKQCSPAESGVTTKRLGHTMCAPTASIASIGLQSDIALQTAPILHHHFHHFLPLIYPTTAKVVYHFLTTFTV